VSLPATAAPEVTELGDAFNQMAERLGESISVISADRDRSRDFVADVSHELRTPIAALRTFNELLRDGAVEDPETRDEFLEQSARQIERMEWLATNLLELSKLDSGLVRLDLRAEDLRGVVESAVQQAEPVAGRKGVDLVVHLPVDAVRVSHDPPRMGQVLTNLIGNAVKFTPAGGRIDVALDVVPEGARISVSDTGVGIPPDELPHVFERFWRGARTRERGSGSGLGLSIVKSIVDMHEGRIQVVSTLGAGTRVTVLLPGLVSVSSPAASAT
jgi:signal transduction histidine kinase